MKFDICFIKYGIPVMVAMNSISFSCCSSLRVLIQSQMLIWMLPHFWRFRWYRFQRNNNIQLLRLYIWIVSISNPGNSWELHVFTKLSHVHSKNMLYLFFKLSRSCLVVCFCCCCRPKRVQKTVKSMWVHKTVIVVNIQQGHTRRK